MLPAVHSCGSAALHRGLGDRRGIAASLGVLGMVATDRGEYARAAALHEEGLRIGRDIGAREVLAEALALAGHGEAPAGG